MCASLLVQSSFPDITVVSKGALMKIIFKEIGGQSKTSFQNSQMGVTDDKSFSFLFSSLLLNRDKSSCPFTAYCAYLYVWILFVLLICASPFLHWSDKVIQEIRKARGSICVIAHNSRGMFSDLTELP